MDERWMRALQAKGINVNDGADAAGGRHRDEHDIPSAAVKRMSRMTVSATRAKPFKATGHKGGISRQGNA